MAITIATMGLLMKNLAIDQKIRISEGGGHGAFFSRIWLLTYGFFVSSGVAVVVFAANGAGLTTMPFRTF
jgi:hypothetical protein